MNGFNFHNLTAFRVDLDDIGLPGAFVLVTSNPKQSGNYRDFYIAHDQIGIVVFMFGCYVENTVDAVEIALANAPDYAPEIFDPE